MSALQVEVQPVGAPRSPLRRRLWTSALVGTGALALAAALVGTGALPAAARPGAHPNRILVVDAAGGLSTVAPDGSDRRSLAVPGRSSGFPAWSPDGTRIATIAGDPTAGGVYVLDAGVGRVAPAVTVYPPSTRYPIYLSWSPDGQRIAFLTSETEMLALRIVLADGSAPSNPIWHGQPLYWAWIDGEHLLVHSGGSAADAFVGEIGLDATTRDAIGDPLGTFQAPGVSADGAELAYVATEADGSASVVVGSRDGHTWARVPVAGASLLAWSPAGHRLAFTSPPRDDGLPYGSLELVDPDTGSRRTLLDGLVIAAAWAPDGRSIAAIRVVAGDVTASASSVSAARATTLELRVVDVASGRTRLARSVRLSALVVSQLLPFFDQYTLSHRIWSPAGDALVLPLVDDVGVAQITVIPIDGTAPRIIADGVAAFWSP